MRIVYCHNNYYFPADENKHYSAGQFPYKYWHPYLEAFKEMRIIGREAEMPDAADLLKMNVSSGPNISFSLFPNIMNPRVYARSYKKIHTKMRQEIENCDGVIIRAVSDLGWLAYHYARKLNKPIAMEMAACAWDSTWNHGNFLGHLYAPIRFVRDKIITANADYVLYVSHDFLPRRYPTNGEAEFASNVRISQSPNQVLDQRLNKIKQSIQTNKPFTIGLIGTLSHKLKGVGDAIKALSILRKQDPCNFALRILGPGDPEEYAKMAKSLGVAQHVHFDGMLQSGSGVLEWLDEVDIYIQPSYQEGVPRATIEAMSRGCPAIGSTAGGIPELLPQQCLHRPGDFKKLSALIHTMSSDAETLIAQASRNFEKSSHYSEELLMPKRIEFWKDFAKFTRQRAANPSYQLPSKVSLIRMIT